MSRDIFFSDVNPNVQRELTARAKSGISRTNKDLQFMLSKIATIDMSVQINAKRYDESGDNFHTVYMPSLTPDPYKYGTQTPTNLFLPTGNNGFLSKNVIKTTSYVDDNDRAETDDPNERSNRTPFFVQNMEISVGDHSYGTLNTATFTIHVPNLQDLDLIDTMFMVPGQEVRIIVAYPEEACITFTKNNFGNVNPIINELLLKTLTDTEKIDTASWVQRQKLHELEFRGLTHSYDIQYNTDFTADITVQIVGKSIAPSNVSLFINQEKKTADLGLPVMTESSKNNKEVVDTDTPAQSFFKSLQTEINNVITKDKSGKDRKDTNSKLETDGVAKNYLAPDAKDAWVVWGKPFPKSAKTYTYITLSYLVDFINRQCLSRIGANFKIIFLRELTSSNTYKHLISADPEIMFFPGQSFYNENIRWYGDTTSWVDGDDTLKFGGYLDEKNNYVYTYSPTTIFINIDMINTILQGAQQQFKISDFLNELSIIVYDLTGHAMDLKLITHPDIATTSTSLCWYDVNYTGETKAKPYIITLSPTSGSAVYDFNLSAKLPENAGTVLYLNNSTGADASDSNVAPYLSYMYNKQKYFATSRDGWSERMKISNTKVHPTEQAKYKEKHEQYLSHLENCKAAYTVGNPQTAINLQNALRKYIQYPTENLNTSQQLTSTILPYEVTFTIDGLNGLKFGDIVHFDILPNKYKNSVVFVITSVTHNITSDGKWSTSCRCQMKSNMKV